jgi:hypothetical protein
MISPWPLALDRCVRRCDKAGRSPSACARFLCAGQHAANRPLGERPPGIQAGKPAEQDRPGVRIRRPGRPPSSVAPQFTIDGAGNRSAGPNLVGRKRMNYRIALGQAVGSKLRFADPPPCSRQGKISEKVGNIEFEDVRRGPIAPISN